MEYLRKQRGIRRVVLFGHSGGAATLSFYQAVAENGTAYCRTKQKLTVCNAELANLPKADGQTPSTSSKKSWTGSKIAERPGPACRN